MGRHREWAQMAILHWERARGPRKAGAEFMNARSFDGTSGSQGSLVGAPLHTGQARWSKNKTCQRARGRKVIFRMISRRRAKTLIAHLCIRESRTSECQGRSAARRSVTGLRTRWAACARGGRRGKAGSILCVGGLSEAAVDTKFLRQRIAPGLR